VYMCIYGYQNKPPHGSRSNSSSLATDNFINRQ